MDSNAIDFTDTGINFVGRTFENNGIQGKIQKRDFEPNEPYTITATVIGNYKYVKYQTEQYYCSQNINKLSPKSIWEKWNEHIAYFTIANVQKFVSLYDGQQGGYKLDDIKSHKVKLPLKNDKIDFDFMESFIAELETRHIAELEARHIAELEAYLRVSGFENYKLTNDESSVIQSFRNQKVSYNDFKIGELFDIHPTKSYGVTNRTLFKTTGAIPVVVNSSIGNGIGGYVDLKPTEKGNMITYTDTTTSEGIFYQPNDFIGYSHIQGLYPLNDIKWSENSLLYFLAAFKKRAAGRFDYATKFNRKVAAEMIVQLPVTPNGDIDFNFMEIFIQAQKKLSIKDVVDRKNIIINKMKQII